MAGQFNYPDISSLETAARLALAAGLSALIGFERESRERAAGLRTHMLVGIASCAMTIVSAYGFVDYYDNLDFPAGSPPPQKDPFRVAAQIVSGIGFLGGGVILRSGLNVRGLTTAASLWAVCGVGLAAGAGMYVVATMLTVALLFSLVALRRVNDVIYDHYHQDRVRITARLSSDDHLDGLLEHIESDSEEIGSFSAESTSGESNEEIVTVNVKLNPGVSRIALARTLKRQRGVLEVHVSDPASSY